MRKVIQIVTSLLFVAVLHDGPVEFDVFHGGTLKF
jgi:hypothetical protein